MGECSRCRTRPSYYTRRYSGESLCVACFKETTVEKVRRTMSRFGMVRRGERVGVAVSGGKDSLSLLKILHEMNSTSQSGSRYELVALTVDEGVRGYREEAIDHARALCDELGVEQFVVSYSELFGFSLDQALDWKDEREVSSCSICGVFRRRSIDEAAVRAKVSVVATAHNLDDYVQTFMMNLLHGDVERLGWLDPSSYSEDFPVRRVKPFTEVYEEEIALYAFLSQVPFQSASCPYMHEGLRSEVRDYLNELEAKHPGMKKVLLSSALEVTSKMSRVGDDDGGGEGGGRSKTLPCTRCGKPSSQGLCGVCRMTEMVLGHSKYSQVGVQSGGG
ncbi:MAG: TIGR00269 family protein [Thaumarchaeota archaeon]|nr:TIGR00269 family protein [Nitrososphaerota archaeon]